MDGPLWNDFFFSQDIPRGYCEYNFSAKESAVKKPLEKHPLHIKVFDQESVHFGTATVDLSKIFSDEATRTLESRSYLGQVPILKKNQLGSADIVGTIEFLFALKEMPNNHQVSNILPTHSTASAFSPVKQVNISHTRPNFYLFYDCRLLVWALV